MTFHTWLALLPALFLLSLVPGPNNLLTAANGVRFGARPAAIAVAGRIVACSATIWVKAGDNQGACFDRAASRMIVAVDRCCNA